MQNNGIVKIGEYTVTRVLGKGAQAYVYLAHNAAGNFFAIKVFFMPDSLKDEVVNLVHLDHINLIKLYESNANGIVTKTGDLKSSGSYAVLEPALGGEIFDFVATGAFPEPIARMYF
jgi:serine/threonine protein kinase